MGPTRISFRRLASLVAPLFLASVALAQNRSQESFYMKVSTSHGVIAGESKDTAHAGWIELRSVRYEVMSGQGIESGKSESNSAPAEASKSPRDAATGQATGKRQYQPVKTANETQMNSAKVATESSTSASSSATSQGSFGKRAREIVVTKITDKSSPELLRAETSGEHLPQVVIEICRGGVCQERLLLKDVVVSAYRTAPTETVTFLAAQIERQ